MPQLDTQYFSSQIFWLLLSFGLLFLMVRYFFIPRVRKILNIRSLDIEDKLQQSKLNIAKISQLENYYNNEIKRIQERVAELQKSSKKDIERDIATKLNSLNLQLAQEYKLAQDNIQNKKHLDISDMAHTLSAVIIKKFYNTSLTEKL